MNKKEGVGALIPAVVMNVINIIIILIYLATGNLFISVIALVIDLMFIAAIIDGRRKGDKAKTDIANLILFSIAAIVSFGFVVFSIIALLAKMRILFSS